MAIPQIKLGNIFEGNTFGLTQSPHGTPDGLAVDGRHPDRGNKKILAPTDGVVEKVIGSGQQRYFHLSCQKWRLRFVHCKPTVKAGTKVKRGQQIGELVVYRNKAGARADHCHLVIFLINTPKCVMIYFDRAIKILLIGPFKNKQWGSWAYWNKNWGNRTLASCEKTIKHDPVAQQIKDLEKSLKEEMGHTKEQAVKYREEVEAHKRALGLLNEANEEIETLEKDKKEWIREKNLLNTKIAELELKVDNQKKELANLQKDSKPNLLFRISEWLKRLRPSQTN